MPTILMATTAGVTFDFLMPFVRHFRRLGWKVDALTGSLDDLRCADEFDGVFHVPWRRNPLDPRNMLTVRQVRRLVEMNRYDLVHVHTSVASFVTRFALRNRKASGPKVVYTAHGLPYHPAGKWPVNTILGSLDRLAAKWTDYTIVINREDFEEVASWNILPPECVRWMPGIGVDLRRYEPHTVSEAQLRALRSELGVENRPWFLTIAEFVARKRHADVLRAFALLTARSSAHEAVLVFAGSGRLETSARGLARSLGIQSRVRFLGTRSDIPALLAGATALVLASDREGLPRCVLEAMAMGLPVIGTRIRGTAELLAGGAGFLFEVGDLATLSTLMEQMLVDPASAADVARRAKARVHAYREEEVVRLHEELYNAVLLGSASATPAADTDRRRSA